MYDTDSGETVELGEVRVSVSGDKRYTTADQDFKHDDTNPRLGRRLRDASLERAERREFAVKKYGDERRWRE